MTIVSAEYNRHSGLGNKLFVWSRAEIFANRHNCIMLQPIWFSPRGEALIRGGVKYKSILKRFWLLDNFISHPRYLSRTKFFFKYRNLPKIYFDDLFATANIKVKDNKHYVFKSTTAFNFKDIIGHHELIARKLNDIIAPGEKKFIDRYTGTPYIGIHIRTGNDFVKKTSGKIGHYMTEVDWFISALKKIRKEYGYMPAYIVSDGGEKQLQAILQESDVTLINSDTAIADLMILSKCKVLLASGSSSFSAWASFLGGMDTYTSKETPFIHLTASPGQRVEII